MTLKHLRRLTGCTKKLPYDLAFEVGEQVIHARIKRGLTQSQLARKTGTKQESIARLESSVCLPSLRFLKRVADAMGMDVVVKLVEKKS